MQIMHIIQINRRDLRIAVKTRATSIRVAEFSPFFGGVTAVFVVIDPSGLRERPPLNERRDRLLTAGAEGSLVKLAT